MIITLVKNAESIKHKPEEPAELTTSGASEVAKSGVMLLHFSGKRPLFSANNQGEYQLNLPEETLPEPDLILTGKENFSRQSGQMIAAIFATNNNVDEIEVCSNSVAVCHPQAFLSQNTQVQHLVIVGSETCLNKWSHFACKNSVKRTPNSVLCIIKDGSVFYDAQTNEKHYMIEGVMDKMLIDGLNSDNPNTVAKILETFPEVNSEKLKTYVKKIGQLPPVQSLLSRIQRENIR